MLGVDFAPTALESARASAASRGLEAEYRVGDLVATGLPDSVAVDPDDPAVPERLRRVDLRRGLVEAGFVDVTVAQRPAWRVAERAMWAEAAALDPGEDPALRSFHDEGVRSLAGFDRVRRVVGSAARPH